MFLNTVIFAFISVRCDFDPTRRTLEMREILLPFFDNCRTNNYYSSIIQNCSSSPLQYL
jgi:hypothetical protein